ncbi:farnesyl cysteine-carboxyl methyltransferase, mediates the carboxyl methylation step during C-termin [Glomus cerebriforme]|uniref:Protein-S-isoprenylcysteine O-methyltransferase n=1 Tax=Glomus cerebriforme TaxID=658196 RepID=A0A397TDV2_9GLOM|nr:farnesyl cysteine-carboxyl methyltransferase, mediates the carboxyl methylation step during C-termin [Glomus cerebriforme]
MEQQEKLIFDGRHTPQNISSYSFCFGIIFGGCLALAYYSETIPQLGIFFSALALFHELEYMMTALFKPDTINLDAFLLNNGNSYHIAHAAGITEFLIELYLFPASKSIRFLRYIGFIVVVIGQLARSIAMWHAKSNFSHKIAYHKRQDHVLITTGIYAYMRHPSYFGFYWWAIGTQLLLSNPICLLGFCYVLHRFFKDRIEEEEPLLIKFFGNDYIKYQKKTRTYIPLIN